jgi:hypothetical protein
MLFIIASRPDEFIQNRHHKTTTTHPNSTSNKVSA